jgi:hypothetical protein
MLKVEGDDENFCVVIYNMYDIAGVVVRDHRDQLDWWNCLGWSYLVEGGRLSFHGEGDIGEGDVGTYISGDVHVF